MAMGGGSKMGEVQSDLNITPLIDVCLVLLIIFMVITPMLQKGIAVQLPKTEAPGKKPDSEKQLLITVDADQKIFVEQNWLPDENFQQKMKDIFDRTPDKELIIKGDQRVNYGEVLKVMRFCNEAGFTNIGLITEKEGAEGA